MSFTKLAHARLVINLVRINIVNSGVSHDHLVFLQWNQSASTIHLIGIGRNMIYGKLQSHPFRASLRLGRSSSADIAHTSYAAILRHVQMPVKQQSNLMGDTQQVKRLSL